MKEHFCPAEKTTITYQGECSWCGESEGGMTQDEIIEMAKEAGFFIIANSPDLFPKLEAFAHLVAAKEREACAKVAERFEPDEKTSYVTYASTAIRARGQA